MSGPIVHEGPVPVTVLAGFLGSGKTTLLNALLAAPKGTYASGEKMAVIVNEFGSVGIDGALVAGGEQFVELDNGCLCCALNEDLVTTLTSLVERGGFDRVLIETTGVADPLPVGWAVTRPGLNDRLRLDAIVTVVDAVAGEALLAAHEAARLQVERADLLLINKCDAAPDHGDAVATAAAAHNPAAVMLRGSLGAWPLAALFDVGHAGPSEHRPPCALVPASRPPAHANIEQVTWQAPDDSGPLDERAVEELAYQVPAAVVRFKGLLHVAAKEGPWLLVHGVAGRIDLRFCTPTRPLEKSTLVFFGNSLPKAELLALCQTLVVPAAFLASIEPAPHHR